jgi:Uma2 family endonuclease
MKHDIIQYTSSVMGKEGKNMAMSIREGKKAFTYSDYLTWPDSERWELIDGEPYAMSPAPSRVHQEIIGEIFLQNGNYLRGKGCRAYVAPFDVVLVDEGNNKEDSRNIVQPDITIVCDKEKLDDRGCKGSPDMIIEVVSPATASLDYVKKLNLYEKYLVNEYWIVNLKNSNIF